MIINRYTVPSTISCDTMDTSGYLRAAEGCSAIAFDVFDTLIVRPFVRPDDLFDFIERVTGKEGFGKARREAERQARRQIRPEIDLDEIYNVLDSRYSDLKAVEIEKEIALCRADSEALALYDSFIKEGKKVILVSDMYLPRGVLEEILEKCGFSVYTKLYLSNELDLNKSSGSVYDLITEENGPVLMIGDNERSDVRNAVSHGLKAERWIPLRERYYDSHPREKGFCRRHGDASLIAGIDMLRWQAFGDGEYWYDTAGRFGGPMVFSFANFVIRCSEGYDRVLFVSRDGYVPMLAYQEMGGADSAYIYCSRMLSTVLGGNNIQDRDSALTIVNYLARKGFPGASEIKDFKDAGTFLSEHSEEAERILKESFGEYSEYAKKVAGEGRILMADTTTMRYSSQRFLSDAAGTGIDGCYFAVTSQDGPIHKEFIDRSRQHLTWSYVNLAEFFFSSAESPLDDVTAKGPVFSSDKSEHERYREEIQPSLERGQLDYVRFAREVLGDYVFDPEALDAWLDVLISYEKGNDPHRLSGMGWGVDKGHKDYRPLLFRASQLPFAVKQTVAGFLRK